MKSKNALATIEQVLRKAKPADQHRFLLKLPRLLNISLETFALLKLAEPSFGFWNNPEDEIYNYL